jgi:hypothetical protein
VCLRFRRSRNQYAPHPGDQVPSYASAEPALREIREREGGGVEKDRKKEIVGVCGLCVRCQSLISTGRRLRSVRVCVCVLRLSRLHATSDAVRVRTHERA